MLMLLGYLTRSKHCQAECINIQPGLPSYEACALILLQSYALRMRLGQGMYLQPAAVRLQGGNALAGSLRTRR